MSNFSPRVAFFVSALMAATLLPLHSSGQIQNPIQAAKDAYNKAKQQAKQQQQQQNSQQNNQTAGQQKSPSSTQDASAPWTPPADDAAATVAPVTIDPAKMPDVVGVRLGMPAQQALTILHTTYPGDLYQQMRVDYWPSTQKPDYGYNLLSRAPGNFKNISLSFTAPPGPQIVWRVMRFTQRMHINRTTLFAALREKYGKETIALLASTYGAAPSDAKTSTLLWLYDERGARVPLPPDSAFPKSRNISECRMDFQGVQTEPVMPKEDDWGRAYSEWCGRHFVALQFEITTGDDEIVENTMTTMEDIPLAIRSSHAAAAWLRSVAQKQRQEDVERSKSAKPTL